MTIAKILTEGPLVTCMAEMALVPQGIEEMLRWVQSRRPECVPPDPERVTDGVVVDIPPIDLHGRRLLAKLLPHPLTEGTRLLSDNELLVEIAGRKCYDSWGEKAGRKTNAEYIAHTQSGDIPHASVEYHPKMTFFIAGVSRRVSHELIRHYVGADRTEEGSPSQESTRYVEHAGWYVAHPAIVNSLVELRYFGDAMDDNYADYRSYIARRFADYGGAPKGMDRKRIFESASAYLSHACETSFIWTTNPVALAKLFRERDHEAADLEFRRLARVWKKLCLERWPNVFCQPWMRGEEK